MQRINGADCICAVQQGFNRCALSLGYYTSVVGRPGHHAARHKELTHAVFNTRDLLLLPAEKFFIVSGSRVGLCVA